MQKSPFDFDSPQLTYVCVWVFLRVAEGCFEGVVVAFLLGFVSFVF